MIRWVVFDAMGVVFTVGDDTNDLLVPFIRERNPGISREAINEVYLRASLGRIPSRQLWEEVGLRAEYPAVEFAYLDGCLTLDPEFVPVARRLAGRFRLGLLSNDLGEWSAYLRRRHSLDFFDAVTISGDVGLRKPAPDIYERFLRDAGARADECLFIDDRAKNLALARSLGFKTIRFARGPETSDFEPDATVAGFGELEAAMETLTA
jgi:HAD superfamily hydrolase (TIGR01549 family)